MSRLHISSDMLMASILLVMLLVVFAAVSVVALDSFSHPDTSFHGECLKSHSVPVEVGKVTIYTTHCDLTATPDMR